MTTGQPITKRNLKKLSAKLFFAKILNRSRDKIKHSVLARKLKILILSFKGHEHWRVKDVETWFFFGFFFFSFFTFKIIIFHGPLHR